MFRLLRFFSRYRDNLLLAGLLLTAFILIIRANDHQRHLAGDALLNASGEVQESVSLVYEYLDLWEENEKLKVQNSQLQEQLDLTRQRLDTYTGMLNADSLELARLDSLTQTDLDTFRYIPGKVIKNTTHKSYNYLVLNKGAKEGVKVDRGVISPQGIVGRVIRVVDNYCLVQSALNVDFELMVMAVPKGEALKPGATGFYEWIPKDNHRARITYVSETVTVKENYEVVTTGNSIVFPPGIRVGRVSEVEKEKATGFYQIDMELATDFEKLRNVYIMDASHRARIDSLETGVIKE